MGPGTTLTIHDIQNDPTGGSISTVSESLQKAPRRKSVAAERPDGNGGTVLTLNQSTIDFIGDPSDEFDLRVFSPDFLRYVLHSLATSIRFPIYRLPID